MQQLDVGSQKREFLPGGYQRFYETLHFIEASDVEFLEPHRLFSRVAHRKKREAVPGHGIRCLLSIPSVDVRGRLKIEPTKFFTES